MHIVYVIKEILMGNDRDLQPLGASLKELADQGFLDFTSAFRIDFLLPAPPTGLARSLSFARSLMSRSG